jgi:hypothetical protein
MHKRKGEEVSKGNGKHKMKRNGERRSKIKKKNKKEIFFLVPFSFFLFLFVFDCLFSLPFFKARLFPTFFFPFFLSSPLPPPYRFLFDLNLFHAFLYSILLFSTKQNGIASFVIYKCVCMGFKFILRFIIHVSLSRSFSVCYFDPFHLSCFSFLFFFFSLPESFVFHDYVPFSVLVLVLFLFLVWQISAVSFLLFFHLWYCTSCILFYFIFPFLFVFVFSFRFPYLFLSLFCSSFIYERTLLSK